MFHSLMLIVQNKDDLSSLSEELDKLSKDLWKESPKISAAFKEAGTLLLYIKGIFFLIDFLIDQDHGIC